MSWKGFKKAVVRLPHQLQLKAGARVDDTVDEEFNFWSDQFKELDELSQRLLDSAQKYRDAINKLAQHQESFAKCLHEIYEPIIGKFTGVSSPTGQQLSNLDPFDQAVINNMKKNRPLTPEKSLRCAQEYHTAAQAIIQSITPNIETLLERKIIKPVEDYCALHKSVHKTLLKRDHKKIDYDRHKTSFRKSKEKVQDRDDERKVAKLEATMEAAKKEFDHFNELLKTELPTYIKLRLEIIDSVFCTSAEFQEMFFTTIINHMSSLSRFLDQSYSAADGYNIRIQPALQVMESIGLLQYMQTHSGSTYTSPQSTASGGTIEVKEFDAETKSGGSSSPHSNSLAASPPSKTNSMFGSSPQPNVLSPPSYTMRTGMAGYGTTPRLVATALFAFQAQQDGDLTFNVGDTIEVIEDSDDVNSWWKGKNCRTGMVGTFPANYVQMNQ